MGQNSSVKPSAATESRVFRPTAGYARRKGVIGDIRRIDVGRVSGITHDGRPFSWKRGPDVELIEFGSFNPSNANYQPGGKPYGSGH